MDGLVSIFRCAIKLKCVKTVLGIFPESTHLQPTRQPSMKFWCTLLRSRIRFKWRALWLCLIKPFMLRQLRLCGNTLTCLKALYWECTISHNLHAVNYTWKALSRCRFKGHLYRVWGDRRGICFQCSGWIQVLPCRSMSEADVLWSQYSETFLENISVMDRTIPGEEFVCGRVFQ